jgi:predicted acylesterase/phospholipase RssA
MTRRALVLSSGGSRGSFEIGVLEELIANRDLDFHIFCGISAGALNAAVLAQARFDADPAKSVLNLKETYSSLRDIWLKSITGNRSIFCKRLLGVVGIALGADSLYDNKPLGDLLNRSLNPQELAQSNRDLRIQYVILETGEPVIVDGADPDIVKHVLASATIPFNFPPVRSGGNHLVDGGVRNNAPIGTAFASEPPPEEIYVVYASPANLDREDFSSAMNAQLYLNRTIEILLNQIDITDFAGAREFNVLKKNWEQIKHLLPGDNVSVKEINTVLDPIRYAKVIECRPERIIIKNGLDFSPTKIRENYEHGKEVAAKLPR